MTTEPPAPLSALEIASGIVTGGCSPLLATETAAPGEMLRAAVRPALERGPCLVSFSGGIDSSLVLSAATQVARRDGLPDPIPITWRFRDAPNAEESDWQERVVAELGLGDWVRLFAQPDELDFVGPVATGVLQRNGLLHPPNAFLHAPMLAHARGGTLLTGVGGDQVLGLWRWRDAAAVLRGDLPLRPRSALTLARSRVPLTIRAQLERGELDADSPWLWPTVDRQVRHGLARELASEPRRWDRRVAWQTGRRHLALGIEALARMAADVGADVAQPLLDRRFTAAIATAGGRHGVGNRAATVERMLGDVLPDALRNRRTKALFDEVFWQAPSRDLVRNYEGEGIDGALVDVPALLALWQGQEGPQRTAHLVQTAWLATH